MSDKDGEIRGLEGVCGGPKGRAVVGSAGGGEREACRLTAAEIPGWLPDGFSLSIALRDGWWSITSPEHPGLFVMAAYNDIADGCASVPAALALTLKMDGARPRRASSPRPADKIMAGLLEALRVKALINAVYHVSDGHEMTEQEAVEVLRRVDAEPPKMNNSEAAHQRLRGFVFANLDRWDSVDNDALAALAEEPDPNGWTKWQETKAQSGQWFLWRNPDEERDIHADQVEPDERGFIEIKHGCGLNYYPECQLLRMDVEVAAAVADAEGRIAARGQP